MLLVAKRPESPAIFSRRQEKMLIGSPARIKEMAKVVKIIRHLPKKVNLVRLADGSEAYGYDCQVGDKCLVWFDTKYNKTKCRTIK